MGARATTGGRNAVSKALRVELTAFLYQKAGA
jgi:hypothetical protein